MLSTMHSQFRSLIYIAAVVSSQVALFAADGPIRGQLPPEGSWVKYEFSGKELRKEPAFGNVKVEIVAKVLGGEIRDATKCRWLEVVLKPTLKDVKLTQRNLIENLDFETVVIKVLVSESGMQQADQEMKVLTAIMRLNDEVPEGIQMNPRTQAAICFFVQSFVFLDDLLLQADQLPDPLITQISQLRGFQLVDKEDKLESKLRTLPAAALAIQSREQKQIKTVKGKKDGHVVTLSIWGHIHDSWRPDFELVPEIPFGVQSIKFVFRFPENFWDQNSPIADVAEFQMKAIEFGDNAKSVLPEFP